MTTFKKFKTWNYIKTEEDFNAYNDAMQDEYTALAARYDDAMKRIHDMQAELEHLRREVNRG